jgi:hypothetical protein
LEFLLFFFIFLLFFSYLGKNFVSYSFNLSDGLLGEATMLYESFFDYIYLIYLILVFPFIMANLNFQLTLIVLLLYLLDFIHQDISTTSTSGGSIALASSLGLRTTLLLMRIASSSWGSGFTKCVCFY